LWLNFAGSYDRKAKALEEGKYMYIGEAFLAKIYGPGEKVMLRAGDRADFLRDVPGSEMVFAQFFKDGKEYGPFYKHRSDFVTGDGTDFGDYPPSITALTVGCAAVIGFVLAIIWVVGYFMGG
jgi:hypothetical protein